MSRKKSAALSVLAQEFEAVLNRHREEEIHTFLAAHPMLLPSASLPLSKFRLGGSYVVDFLLLSRNYWSNSPSPLLTLVELERADGALFTRAGDPTSFLTHALRQVQDWKLWVSDNRASLNTALHRRVDAIALPADRDERETFRFLARGLPYGFGERYFVTAGRRAKMTITERLRLSQMNSALHPIQVITYDVLLERLLWGIKVRLFDWEEVPE